MKVKNALVKLNTKWILNIQASSPSKLFQTSGEQPLMELEASSPNKETTQTLLEKPGEVEEKLYDEDDELPDI